MDQLLDSISSLRTGPVGRQIKKRVAEFRSKRHGTAKEIFQELCFCILTANYTSEGGIRMQKEIGDGFRTLPEIELSGSLRKLGYRFPNARAKYIVAARSHLPRLKEILDSTEDPYQMRDWFAQNVYGFGYKESSHFLRNIGFLDYAIIDFHIIDLLARHGLIRKPPSKSLSKKSYLAIEGVLQSLADESGIRQGELDLYLWYLETGKILK